MALVSPEPRQIYSGMLPGVIAGHYRREEAEIDVAALARRAGAQFVEAEVTGLDPARRRTLPRSGSPRPRPDPPHPRARRRPPPRLRPCQPQRRLAHRAVRPR